MKSNRILATELLVNHTVGRDTPCAPQVKQGETARRGLTRPTTLRSWPALLSCVVALITISLPLLCPASAHAQGGVPLWTSVLPGEAMRMAVDSSGNVFVTGSAATVKYSNDGLPLWTNRGGSALAVDATGKVFVTGNGNGTVAYSSDGVPLWTNSASSWAAIAVDGSGKVFVTDQGSATVAYSNAGVPLWTNRYTTNIYQVYQTFYKMALNSSGNVFVTVTEPGDYPNQSDIVTIAYSNDGVPLWTNRYNGPGNTSDGVAALAVDGSGNVFVAGGSGGYNATIKYSGAGVPLWTNQYLNGPYTPSDSAGAIAVDGQGNVFVTGNSSTEFCCGEADYATIKYSNAGVPLWTNRYDGLGHYSDSAAAIAVDSSGNVFVTGRSLYNLPGSPRPGDCATIAYSNEGVPLWTNLFNAPDGINSAGNGIAVDSLSNVFVTGYSIDSNWNYHWTMIKYSSSVPPPVHLEFQKLNNELVLGWTNAGFTLQTAPAVTGPFTNLPAATSPYTNPITAPQQFFRLKLN